MLGLWKVESAATTMKFLVHQCSWKWEIVIGGQGVEVQCWSRNCKGSLEKIILPLLTGYASACQCSDVGFCSLLLVFFGLFDS